MLYDIAFFIFSIFYLPALIFKGKLHKDFAERFGNYDKAKMDAYAAAKDAIWIEAVSVGEVAVCKTLIPLIRKELPGRSIVVSTVTKTGNDLAKKLFSNDAIIIYFPLDFSMIVRKVVGLIKPKAYVMIETEIWPNLIKELAGRSVPCILINGRISDRSFGQYKLAKPFLKKTLGRIRSFCMQSQIDADRIMEMGAPSDRVKVTGNMKFDIEIKYDAHMAGELKRILDLDDHDRLFVAGSTHSGEEDIVIDAFKEIKKEFPGLKLLIAPRHIERTCDVETMVRQHGLTSQKISDLIVKSRDRKATSQVLILDTIGRLNDFYSIATVVFVGGSLIPHGGQNPIEPVVFSKPVIFGPHMFNFRSITKVLLDNKGAIQVGTAKELLIEAQALFHDSAKCLELARSAKMVVDKNRGAALKNLEAIKSA